MLEIKDAARLLIDQLGWVDVIDVDQSDGLVSYRKTTDRRQHVVRESAVLGLVQHPEAIKPADNEVYFDLEV